jgi:hypothetical protein
MTAVTAAFAFVRANWTWLLPVICVGLALTWAAIERDGRQRCELAWARERDAQQKAILAQKERDRILGAQIQAELADQNARIDRTATKHSERIRYVEVTTNCERAPAMRAADDGLLDLGFSREAGPAAGRIPGQAGGAATRPCRRGRRSQGRGATSLRRGLSQAGAEVRRLSVLGAGAASTLRSFSTGEQRNQVAGVA